MNRTEVLELLTELCVQLECSRLEVELLRAELADRYAAERPYNWRADD